VKLPALKSVLSLTLVSILIGHPSPLSAQTQEALAPLELGTANLQIEGRQETIGFFRSPVGPLFALHDFMARLGGELTIGPAQVRHELKLGNESFLFGPESLTMTLGEKISYLSQAPRADTSGLLVPLDLLQMVYTEVLGYEFVWDAGAKSLSVHQRPPAEYPVEVSLVHLQGVSTLVLKFPEQPRYRVHKKADGVEVELIGDRFASRSQRAAPSDPLVRGVTIGRDRLVVQLAPGAVAEDYVLDRPFRLVFDVYRGQDSQAITEIAPPEIPRREEGIRTIVLDPGHGGENTGAMGPGGSTEKDLTMILARTLKTRLERRLPLKVFLTRDDDTELPLDSRAALANQQKADLFISIHLNSSPTTTATGAETYFSSLEATNERAANAASFDNQSGSTADGNGDPLYDLQLILWDLAQSHHMAESHRLASLIQEELNQTLSLRNRGVKQAPFTVLLSASMPAVLVELGFLSNPSEEAKLRDPAYRGQLADAIVEAVLRFKALKDGEQSPDPEALL
jgi:N-acetylmuramoyl-L-alanine amidase